MSKRRGGVAVIEVPVPAEPRGFTERTYEVLAELDLVRARLEKAVDQADAEDDDERGRRDTAH